MFFSQFESHLLTTTKVKISPTLKAVHGRSPCWGWPCQMWRQICDHTPHKGYKWTPSSCRCFHICSAEELWQYRNCATTVGCPLLIYENDAFKIQNVCEGKGLSSQTHQLCSTTPSMLRAGKRQRG